MWIIETVTAKKKKKYDSTVDDASGLLLLLLLSLKLQHRAGYGLPVREDS
jgi:hypothetical protein